MFWCHDRSRSAIFGTENHQILPSEPGRLFRSTRSAARFYVSLDCTAVVRLASSAAVVLFFLKGGSMGSIGYLSWDGSWDGGQMMIHG